MTGCGLPIDQPALWLVYLAMPVYGRSLCGTRRDPLLVFVVLATTFAAEVALAVCLLISERRRYRLMSMLACLAGG